MGNMLPKSNEIDIEILNKMINYSLTTSYKLFWFQAIVKEVLQENTHITYSRLVYRMIANAYPLVRKGLNLGSVDKLYDLVDSVNKQYNIDTNIKEDAILNILDSINDKEIQKKVEKIYNFVPYRLLTPFFKEQLHGKSDVQKNKEIIRLTQFNSDVFYRIDIDSQMIHINPKWVKYIVDNKDDTNKWFNSVLDEYLKKRN